VIAWDTETRLIAPGRLAPEIMCATYCTGTAPALVTNGDGWLEAFAHTLLQEDTVGHNVAYDLACVASTFPHLLPRIFEALHQGRVHDTQIREKLLNLATFGEIENSPAGSRISYSLSELARARCGLDLSAGKEGEDIWRLRYAELDGFRAEDYPKEAADYALLDAQATYEVWAAQEEEAREIPGVFDSEHLHVAAAFGLYLMTAYGVRVDKKEKERIQAEVVAALDPEVLPLLYAPLDDFGLPPLVNKACPGRPKKTKDHEEGCSRKPKTCTCPYGVTKPKDESVAKKAALVPLVVAICEQEDIPLTPTKKAKEINVEPTLENGYVSTSAEVLEAIAPFHPALEQFLTRAKLIKLITSYFPAMEWPYGSGITAPVIHPNYDYLKATGRTSSWGVSKKRADKAVAPAVNIQQADPRVRPAYVPRPGWLFAIADYSALELVSLAQTILDLYGHSALADQINAGIDPHAYLGCALAVHGDPAFRMVLTELHGEERTEDQEYEFFLTQKRNKPEWFKHWRTLAKPVGLGFPGGMGINTFRAVAAGYGFKLSVAEAKNLKRIWLMVYPNMKRYLNTWVPGQPGSYVSPAGMRRVECRFTQLANGRALQTPGAEGAKKAVFNVSRACYDRTRGSILYGCRPVAFIHDEILMEVPDDCRRSDRAHELAKIMEDSMTEVLPDVQVRAEPILSTHWSKEAEQVWDTPTTLGVWSPA